MSFSLISIVENSTIFIPGSNASNNGSLHAVLQANIRHDSFLFLLINIITILTIHFVFINCIIRITVLIRCSISLLYSDSNPAQIIYDNVTRPTRGNVEYCIFIFLRL